MIELSILTAVQSTKVWVPRSETKMYRLQDISTLEPFNRAIVINRQKANCARQYRAFQVIWGLIAAAHHGRPQFLYRLVRSGVLKSEAGSLHRQCP